MSELLQVLWMMHLHAHEMYFPNLEILVYVLLPSFVLKCPILTDSLHSTEIWCPSLTISPLVK
jgi:hypothetical protein